MNAPTLQEIDIMAPLPHTTSLVYCAKLFEGLIFQDSCIQNLDRLWKSKSRGRVAFKITHGAYYFPNSLQHHEQALFHHCDT